MKISELPGDEDAGGTCRTYVFQNESHTLGNALKCIISRYEDVQFCGYTVPHPSEDKMHFRIQSIETPALDILKRGLADLEKVCDHTISLFDNAVKILLDDHKVMGICKTRTKHSEVLSQVFFTIFQIKSSPLVPVQSCAPAVGGQSVWFEHGLSAIKVLKGRIV